MFELSYSTSGDEAMRTLTAADRLPVRQAQVWQAPIWQAPAEAVNHLQGLTPLPLLPQGSVTQGSASRRARLVTLLRKTA